MNTDNKNNIDVFKYVRNQWLHGKIEIKHEFGGTGNTGSAPGQPPRPLLFDLDTAEMEASHEPAQSSKTNQIQNKPVFSEGKGKQRLNSVRSDRAEMLSD